jgi:hypothetical protein
LENLKQLDPKKYRQIVREISKQNREQLTEDEKDVRNLKKGKLPQHGKKKASVKKKNNSNKQPSTKTNKNSNSKNKTNVSLTTSKNNKIQNKDKVNVKHPDANRTKLKAEKNKITKINDSAKTNQGLSKKDNLKGSLNLNDSVLYAFGVYVLVKIYNSDPEIKVTSKIMDKFKHNLEDQHLFTKNLLFFREVEMHLFFSEKQLAQLGQDVGNRVYEVILNASPAKIYSIFKANRVQMQKDAKVLIEQQIKNR